MSIIIKQFVHDGLVFYFTDSVVESDKDVIGFYFDRLGYPQEIRRKSMYGGYIISNVEAHTSAERR
jgi:hypothetical protein